jgi:hypothetical protein
MLIWNLSLLMKLLISIMLVKHTVAQLNRKIQSKSVTDLHRQRYLK